MALLQIFVFVVTGGRVGRRLGLLFLQLQVMLRAELLEAQFLFGV